MALRAARRDHGSGPRGEGCGRDPSSPRSLPSGAGHPEHHPAARRPQGGLCLRAAQTGLHRRQQGRANPRARRANAGDAWTSRQYACALWRELRAGAVDRHAGLGHDAGWVSLGYFSLTIQREVTRPSGRNALALDVTSHKPQAKAKIAGGARSHNSEQRRAELAGGAQGKRSNCGQRQATSNGSRAEPGQLRTATPGPVQTAAARRGCPAPVPGS